MSKLAMPVVLLALVFSACQAAVNEPPSPHPVATCASDMSPPSVECVSVKSVPDRRTVAWETWVACKPPYFDSRGQCVTEIEREEVEAIVHDTGFLAGTGSGGGGGGGSSVASSGRGMRGFSPTDDVKGCCTDHGGIAGCVTGTVLCRDGTYSVSCGC